MAAQSSHTPVRQLGLVVHPTRDLDEPLDAVRAWAQASDVKVVQVPVPSRQRDVAPEGSVEDCDVIVSIGGDGTMLAATRAAMAARRPVLGIACGSLGALTSVGADKVEQALERFRSWDWEPRRLPALEIRRDGAEDLLALNDLAIVRAGQGQVRVRAEVDGVLYARFAGDGGIVSTAVGSSAYSFAAGGPLLAPGADAFLLTPLPAHGGSHPALVIGAGSRLKLVIDGGFAGARLELDGQPLDDEAGTMEISLRGEVATLVNFTDQEPMLSGLRRRGIITDSPRIVADDKRH